MAGLSTSRPSEQIRAPGFDPGVGDDLGGKLCRSLGDLGAFLVTDCPSELLSLTRIAQIKALAEQVSLDVAALRAAKRCLEALAPFVLRPCRRPAAVRGVTQ